MIASMTVKERTRASLALFLSLPLSAPDQTSPVCLSLLLTKKPTTSQNCCEIFTLRPPPKAGVIACEVGR
jgi:hypothetical protein